MGPEGIGGSHAAGLRAPESATETAAGARRLVGAGLALPAEASLTIPGLLLDVVARRHRQVALRAKRMGIYQNISWIDLFDKISRIGLGLRALGVKRGDRVAIIGDPLPEWLMCDFAAQCLGAISYGLYPTSSRDEVGFVLRHGGASVLIAEDQEHVDKVLPMLGQLPDLRKLVVIDDSNMFGYADPALMSLNDLIGLGASVAGGPDEYLRLCRAVRPDDPATIVYTSGTSANPKGAVYTHRALITQGHQFLAFPELTAPEDFRSVVHLPLNHLYERMNTPLGMLVKGHRSAFWRRGRALPRNPLRGRSAASRVGPALLVEARFARHRRYREQQRLQEVQLQSRYARRPSLSPPALERRTRLGIGCVVPACPPKRVQPHAQEDRPAAGPHRAVRGRAIAERGAGLVAGLGRQSEEPLRPDRRRRAGGAVRFISPPGFGRRRVPGSRNPARCRRRDHLQVPGCFAGYWGDTAASSDMLRPDGIHTGDVGMLDADGQLWIVDRKKDIVITAGGKNVSPSRIETALKSSPYISEASVIGEGRKYLTVLIELDVGTVSEWARANEVSYTSYRSLATNRAIYTLIEQEVRHANEQLGRVEQVKAFRILDRELDPEVEGEAVTPTRKIKRSLLQQHFGHLISQMYSDDEEQRIAANWSLSICSVAWS